MNKGHDRVTTTFYDSGKSDNNSRIIDEVKMYYDFRYLSSCEAIRRIFSFDIHYRELSVEILSFHLPEQQLLIFGDDEDINELLNK